MKVDRMSAKRLSKDHPGFFLKKVLWTTLPLVFFLSLMAARAVESDEIKSEAQHEASAPKSESTHERPKIEEIRTTFSRQACLVDATALEDLRKAKEEIANQKKEFAAKETELKAREQALNEELGKLRKARDELSAAQALKNAEDEAKLSKLVETLLTMSPKAASKLLTTIDEDLAVDAIYRMDTQRLGKILNVMDTSRSSRLSELMVGIVQSSKNNPKAQENSLKAQEKGGSPYDRKTEQPIPGGNAERGSGLQQSIPRAGSAEPSGGKSASLTPEKKAGSN